MWRERTNSTSFYDQVTKFVNESEVKEKPKHGCYITGLYLEGADWDLNKSELKSQVLFLNKAIHSFRSFFFKQTKTEFCKKF